MKKITILILSIVLLFLVTPPTKAGIFEHEFNTSIDSIISDNYQQVLASWYANGYRDDIQFKGVISPSNFTFEENSGSLILDNSYDDYLFNQQLPNHSNGEVFAFDIENNDTKKISTSITVDSAGLYKIGLDYYSETTSIGDIEIEVLVNGKKQYYEAGQVLLPTYWKTSSEFNLDRYGNDIMPNSVQERIWSKYDFRDSQRLYEQAILFKLDEGINVIEIISKNGNFKLGQIYVSNLENYIEYEAYIAKYHSELKVKDQLIEVEAENISLKNDVSIRYSTDRNPMNTPFSLIESRLNIIDGATYDKSGQTIFYDIDIKQTGLYQITLKSRQDKQYTKNFRTLTINGKVPFDEAQRIAFESSPWVNKRIENNTEYWFYLEQGINRIGFEVNSGPYREIYQSINSVMKGVNDLALDIKKLTGNQIDENRDWEITEYLPNLQTDLKQYAQKIENAYLLFKEISGTDKDADISAGLKAAYGWLYELSDNPNDVPKKISRLTGATASVLQRLGIVLPLVIDSPLTIDIIYIHGSDIELKKANPGFFQGLWYETRRFISSFFSNQFGLNQNDEELTIWVNRSRQYVNLMQQMTDDEFTQQTGIKVNISLMPNEDKLILATSSGTQPDLAMGVAGWRPYDFAIRNALVNLAEFEDFREVTKQFNPGAFMQLIYQDGVYGLPETQNFNVLFYRKDILESLNLEVPDTWDDVLDTLPELQRFGMNFYSMLSSTSAFKGFSTTMPFIMQQGGSLYTDGALSSTLDNQELIDAMTLMTDLYTVYALPLEVGSFYNQFRYGNMPIGVGDFGMYIQLLFAAPEIAGLWDIAPLPGIESNGVIDRSYDGASTSSMIFKNSSKQSEAWEFLKWWMEAENQLNYASNLMTAYGPEYMWNTANVQAFKNMNMNQAHKEVFLTQWDYVLDTAKTPASYMLEREISNAWNRVVYDGINVRTAMEDAKVVVNREITRKMLEFGFINNKGEVVQPYLLPTKETLDKWVHVND